MRPICHCSISVDTRPRHGLKIRPGGMRYLENHDRGDEDDGHHTVRILYSAAWRTSPEGRR